MATGPEKVIVGSRRWCHGEQRLNGTGLQRLDHVSYRACHLSPPSPLSLRRAERELKIADKAPAIGGGRRREEGGCPKQRCGEDVVRDDCGGEEPLEHLQALGKIDPEGMPQQGDHRGLPALVSHLRVDRKVTSGGRPLTVQGRGAGVHVADGSALERIQQEQQD